MVVILMCAEGISQTGVLTHQFGASINLSCPRNVMLAVYVLEYTASVCFLCHISAFYAKDGFYKENVLFYRN